MYKKPDNLILHNANSKACHVCKELLDNMNRFFEILDSARKIPADDWLTVDVIAKELRISKSIVYRLIRNGKIEAVNLVENNGKISCKGHYRIKRSSLNQYLESKKVKTFPNASRYRTGSRHTPKVKNHLGL
jgi:excisionase family DNA binding protein